MTIEEKLKLVLKYMQGIMDMPDEKQLEPKAAGEFRWSIALDVECPGCDHLFDASSEPDFFEQIRGYQVCEAAKDREVQCPECKLEFIFDIGDGQ